jgi:energy-converting hydrogenase B subunit D
MTGLWIVDYACLLLVLACAVLVIGLRSLSAAVMALSAMGTVLGVLFIVLAAPDVALAEVVVGAIATPVLYLIAIGKIRTDVVDRGDLGEEAENGSPRR